MKTGPIHYEFVIDALGTTSDISGIARNVAWIENATSPDVGLTQGLGYGSGVSVLTGPLQVALGLDNWKTAAKTNDVAKKRFAAIRMVRGVSDTLAGVGAMGMRTTTLIGLSSTSKTVTVAGRLFGIVSSSFWMLSFVLQILRFTMALSDAIKAYKDNPTEANRNAILRNIFILVGLVIGIVSFVMTVVYTGGITLVVGYILMLVMNLMLSSMDVYCLYESIKNLKSTNLKDLIVQVLYILLNILSMVVGGLFAGSLPMLAVIMAVGAATLIVQGGLFAYSIHKLKKPEEDEIASERDTPVSLGNDVVTGVSSAPGVGAGAFPKHAAGVRRGHQALLDDLPDDFGAAIALLHGSPS